jgi:hypothetical protein
MDFFNRTLQTVPQAFVNRWMQKDEVKRSFQVRLLCEKKSESWQVLFSTLNRFSTGWKAFAISNGLQEGDNVFLKYVFDVHVIKHGLHDDCVSRQKKRNVTGEDEDMCGKPKSFHG